jgi:glycosyltransferase involved in cell wall biosynthesis
MIGFPMVTVMIAAHNRLEMLKDAVNSALMQEFDSFEVLVVDDGSDEETLRWLDEEANIWEHLRVIHQENSGVAIARQNGLMEARGEFVCILDSDDRLMPYALNNIVSVFVENPETDLVYCNNRQRMGSERIRAFNYPRFDNNKAMIRSTFLRPVVPFKHSGTTFRRDVALALGGYDTNLPLKVDIDLFLKFLGNRKHLYLLEDSLVEYRMHKDSISAQRLLGIKVWWHLIDRYGPKGRTNRFFYKTTRTFAELFKLVYLQLRMN